MESEKMIDEYSEGDGLFLYPDFNGEGAKLWYMTGLLNEAKARGFYGIEVGDGLGLKLLGCGLWSVLLNPALPLLNASTPSVRLRIRPKYVN
jgi:hypothetical protein